MLTLLNVDMLRALLTLYYYGSLREWANHLIRLALGPERTQVKVRFIRIYEDMGQSAVGSMTRGNTIRVYINQSSRVKQRWSFELGHLQHRGSLRVAFWHQTELQPHLARLNTETNRIS